MGCSLKRINNCRNYAKRVLAVCDSIENGGTTIPACKENNIDVQWFRRFLADEDKSFNGDLTWLNKELNGSLSEKEKFMCDLFGLSPSKDEIIVLDDFDEAFELTTSVLSERQAKVLRLYYFEGKTLSEIADMFGLSSQVVSQIKAKAMMVMRHPRRSCYFVKGVEYCMKEGEVKELRKINCNIDSFDKSLRLLSLGISDLVDGDLASLGVLEEDLKELSSIGITSLKDVNVLISKCLKALGLSEESARNMLDCLKNNSKYDSASVVTLEDLGLSVRAYNCLKRAGYNKLSDFKGKTEEEIMRVKNLGRKSYFELCDCLLKYGITLNMGVDVL